MVLFGSDRAVMAQSADLCDDMPYYVEIVISDVEIVPNIHNYMAANEEKEITKTKTARVRAGDGTVLWSVSVTATFSYNGTTSKCISCSHNAVSYVEAWSIKSVTSEKSGNEATATAVATHSVGSLSKDSTQSVTIKCSKNGAIS